jgi:hypothetical protein
MYIRKNRRQIIVLLNHRQRQEPKNYTGEFL